MSPELNRALLMVFRVERSEGFGNTVVPCSHRSRALWLRVHEELLEELWNVIKHDDVGITRPPQRLSLLTGTYVISIIST